MNDLKNNKALKVAYKERGLAKRRRIVLFAPARNLNTHRLHII